MTIIESIILGAVQGLTEFLPVSSSGHLQIAKALLGVEIEENLAFDVTLHAATVLSTIVILWPEVKRLIVGVFSRHFNAEQAYALKLILSMIPIGIVGFAFKDYIDAMLESPYILTIVGAMLLLTAVLLAFAYYARPRQKEEISYRDAFIIGIGQAIAAMPGLSRPGTETRRRRWRSSRSLWCWLRFWVRCSSISLKARWHLHLSASFRCWQDSSRHSLWAAWLVSL